MHKFETLQNLINSSFKMKEVKHHVNSPAHAHQEVNLQAHVDLTLKSTKFVSTFVCANAEIQEQMLCTSLVHDIGKAVQWPFIDKKTAGWSFSGHGVVGAVWLWEQVLKNGWDQKWWRPVYLAVWFHMIKYDENKGVIGCLDDRTRLLFETLCCADNHGRSETFIENPETPLATHEIPKSTTIPNLPILLYVFGKSGVGKTTFAKKISEELESQGITWGYSSHDKGMLEIMRGITTPWADMDPSIRGSSIKDKNTIYSSAYTEMTKDPVKQKEVYKHLSKSVNSSLKKNEVTIFTTTAKLDIRMPFINSKSLKIVVVPDRAISDIFPAKFHEQMGVEKGFSGWAHNMPYIFVPETEANIIIPHIIKMMKSNPITFTPPEVKCPKDMIPLLKYWESTTGSVSGMCAALITFYDIVVVRNGGYINLAYNDGSPYDDPFNPGSISPSCFCRGNTFYVKEHKSEGDGEGESERISIVEVRQPMPRGREISLTTDIPQDALEDFKIKATFYDNLTREMSNSKITFTGKIDGFLILCFKPEFINEIEVNRKLKNEQGLVFGTKGRISMADDLADALILSLKYENVKFKDFAEKCASFMQRENLSTLAFECVGEKRNEFVVEYPTEFRGMYFLGGARDGVFQPFFSLNNSNFKTPPKNDFIPSEIKDQLLTSFPEHLEGSIIFVEKNGVYFPLKNKTQMYYILHKNRNTPDVYTYLEKLISRYGWIHPIPLNFETLSKRKVIHSLFALVDMPEVIWKNVPAYVKAREKWNYFMSQKTEPAEGLDRTQWRQFHAVYMTGKWHSAYELFEN
jgi:hypothetical protein